MSASAWCALGRGKQSSQPSTPCTAPRSAARRSVSPAWTRSWRPTTASACAQRPPRLITCSAAPSEAPSSGGTASREWWERLSVRSHVHTELLEGVLTGRNLPLLCLGTVAGEQVLLRGTTQCMGSSGTDGRLQPQPGAVSWAELECWCLIMVCSGHLVLCESQKDRPQPPRGQYI